MIRGNKKPVDFKRKDPPKLNAKACLISGSPGIGKTTTVRIIGQKLGFHILELNASDVRSKTKIEELLRDLSKAQSITTAFNAKPPLKDSRNVFKHGMAPKGGPQKTMILMDEVDGCGASDRGGLGALVKIIKDTKQPIVCICNDYGAQKLKTLKNYCYDLRFYKPTPSEVISRVVQIAASEGLEVDP